MRFRSTLILAVVLLGLGAYLYFIELGRVAQEGIKEKLLSFEPDDVSAVTLTYPDREIVLRRSDGEWRLTAPVDAPAEDSSVQRLIEAIADCEINKTLDDVPDDLAPFGLDPPSVTVHIAIPDHELPLVRVGKTTPVGNSAYVQRSDQPQIRLTASSFHTNVNKQANDLRDRLILRFDKDEVRRLALRGEGGDIVLSKATDGWNIEEPGPYTADAGTVGSFLSTLSTLRATDFAAENPSDLTTYGLEAPRRTIALSIGADGTETDLLVGGENDKQEIYVKSADRPTVYTAGSWLSRDFNKGVNDFRDKTVLSFEPADVKAVEVTRDGAETFVLKRNDSGDWAMAEAEGAVDGGGIDRFVNALSNLDGYEIASEGADDLASYGLAPPTVNITVRATDDTSIGTVRLGSYKPDPPETQYTAMREGGSTVFHLREYLFKQLDKKKSDFLSKPTAVPANGGD